MHGRAGDGLGGATGVAAGELEAPGPGEGAGMAPGAVEGVEGVEAVAVCFMNSCMLF